MADLTPPPSQTPEIKAEIPQSPSGEFYTELYDTQLSPPVTALASSPDPFAPASVPEPGLFMPYVVERVEAASSSLVASRRSTSESPKDSPLSSGSQVEDPSPSPTYHSTTTMDWQSSHESLQAQNLEVEDETSPIDNDQEMITGSDAEDDFEDEEDPDFEISESGERNCRKKTRSPANSSKPKATRRPKAKTAREYHLRKNADQAKTDAIRKTWPRARSGIHKTTRAKTKSRKKADKSKKPSLSLFMSLNDDSAIAVNNGQSTRGIDPVPEINATTKAGTFEQLLSAAANLDMHKTNTDLAQLRKDSRTFGNRNMIPINGKWQLKGMTAILPHHQMMAAAWMIGKEYTPHGPFGGILADTMGLGKTVEILTAIAGNLPDEMATDDEKATLIIVPSNVLVQWGEEIPKHAGEIFRRVLTYRSKHAVQEWQLFDCQIVLTTYAELIKSCPQPDGETMLQLKKKAKTHKFDLGKLILNWIEANRGDGGLLHQIPWYRIVLDEGHVCRNRLSQRSIAASALLGKHRWVVTGTPASNRLEELYAYYRFLKHPSDFDFEEFRGEFCDPNDTSCTQRLAALLDSTMLRRTGNDKILGVRLLNLPDPDSKIREVRMSRPEAVLYMAIKERFRALFAEHLQKKDPLKNLTYLLVQIIRMRQLVGHPLLIEHQIVLMFSLEALHDLRWQLLKSAKGVGLADRVSIWIHLKETSPEYQKDLQDTFEGHCMLCHDVPTDPQVIDVPTCQHVFCDHCIEDYSIQQADEADFDNKFRCPMCSSIFAPNDCRNVPRPGQKSKKGPKKSSPEKRFSKGKDCRKFIPATTESRWLNSYDAKKASILPAAKVLAIDKQVLEWQKEAPEDKIIIFVQFKLLATIIGRQLHSNNIGFVYYIGDMDHSQKGKAIKTFEDDPSCKVFISGLQCGGVGLNLAFANRVIIVDLWWNTAVEAQAFGRVHRMGQKKQTHLVRIGVKKTIDIDLLKLQKDKEATLSLAMQDQRSPEIYLGLFGRVVKDEWGNIIGLERDHSESDIGSDDDDPSAEETVYNAPAPVGDAA